jgi:hypothetical protein
LDIAQEEDLSQRVEAHNLVLPLRALAFIDILGFREIVSSRGRRAYRLPLMASHLVSHQIFASSDYQVSVFSDCVAISGPIERAGSVAFMALCIGKVYLQDGILPRGGLVLGELYHENPIIIGPALINAYDIERTVAKYPRLVIDDPFASLLLRQDQQVKWKHLIRRDIDGCYFLDLLTWLPPCDWREEGVYTELEFAEAVRASEVLRAELAALYQEAMAPVRRLDHLSKLRWLIHQFNDTVQSVKSPVPIINLPDDQPES